MQKFEGILFKKPDQPASSTLIIHKRPKKSTENLPFFLQNVSQKSVKIYKLRFFEVFWQLHFCTLHPANWHFLIFYVIILIIMFGKKFLYVLRSDPRENLPLSYPVCLPMIAGICCSSFTTLPTPWSSDAFSEAMRSPPSAPPIRWWRFWLPFFSACRWAPVRSFRFIRDEKIFLL